MVRLSVCRPPRRLPGFGEFERLVDAHVTPHMVGLGYADRRLQRRVQRRILVAEQPKPVRWFRHRLERAFSQAWSRGVLEGYEALTDEAAARVLPGDPLTADEAWLYLDPNTGHLDFFLREGLPRFAERYGTKTERTLIVSEDQPLPDRLRALDTLLARFVAETG